MATLTVNVDDALLERIADAAHERGEDTEHVIVEVLKQAFQSSSTEDDITLADKMLEVLAPFWAEQDRQEAENAPQSPKGAPGDAVEEYLARHWAEDIRKGSASRSAPGPPSSLQQSSPAIENRGRKYSSTI
jgi:hypothetical protein